MFASSESVMDELEGWVEQLKELLSADVDTIVDPVGQLAVESTIAAGVSILAAEPISGTSLEPSGRPILARDLIITTDLVLRALKEHTETDPVGDPNRRGTTR